MTRWLGINTAITKLADTAYASESQTNTRMEVEGELQRRWGYTTTSLAKQAFPIIGIAGAYPPGRTFAVFQPSDGTLQGLVSPLPGWTDAVLQRPIGSTGSTCSPYSQADNGTTSSVSSFTLPAGSCVGLLSVNGAETARSAPFYGYQFTATADGVNILTSGCLTNVGTSAAIPAGTLSVVVTITGGCSGAGPAGTWSISVSS